MPYLECCKCKTRFVEHLAKSDDELKLALSPVINKSMAKLLERAQKAAPNPDVAVVLKMMGHMGDNKEK